MLLKPLGHLSTCESRNEPNQFSRILLAAHRPSANHWNKIFRLTIRIANYQPRFLPRASPPRTSNSWCPLLNFLRLLRGRLIGRTPDFESGYRGSSPRPGANLLLILAADPSTVIPLAVPRALSPLKARIGISTHCHSCGMCVINRV